VQALARQRGRAERRGGGCTAPRHRDPRFRPPIAEGQKDHIAPRVLAVGDQQMYSGRICSFLCFAIPLLYSMNKPETKLLALSICFMYREESNQRPRIQIASVNAFDLRRHAITQAPGTGTPLTV